MTNDDAIQADTHKNSVPLLRSQYDIDMRMQSVRVRYIEAIGSIHL